VLVRKSSDTRLVNILHQYQFRQSVILAAGGGWRRLDDNIGSDKAPSKERMYVVRQRRKLPPHGTKSDSAHVSSGELTATPRRQRESDSSHMLP
jgi:hypothetical protein